MTKRHHFIDQRGEFVYMMRDKDGTCRGCCYNDGDADAVRCKRVVPAEHVTVGNTPGLINALKCVRELKIYKEMK